MSHDLPEGWKAATLSELANITLGQSPKAEETNEGGLGLPFFQGNAEFGEMYPEPRRWAENGPRTAEPGDILISVRAPVGELNLAPQRCFIGRGLAAIKATALDERFLLYALRFSVPQLQSVSQGSTFDAVNRGDLSNLGMAVPPLSEQRRIAEILSSVDGTIAATQAVIDHTRKVKQGALERLLTKGIGHTRFKQTEVGEIPEGWVVSTLADAGVRIIDGDRGKEYPKAEDYLDHGYCLFLNAKNVTRSGFSFRDCQFISEDKHKKLRNGLLERSDIVVTTRGTIGNFAFFDANVCYDYLRINSGMAILRSAGSEILPEFLYALTSSMLLVRQISRRVFGSAQPQLTLDILRKLIIPLPPKDEQVLIAFKAHEFADVEKTQLTELAAMEALKSALMSDLLTGRKRVTDTLPLAAE